MNNTDQHLEHLARQARAASPQTPDSMPLGFTTRVLANVRSDAPSSQLEAATLWARLSLASLPFAALATAACLHWLGIDTAADARDLAEMFVQAPFQP